jgi:hypothetical protein
MPNLIPLDQSSCAGNAHSPVIKKSRDTLNDPTSAAEPRMDYPAK